MRPTLWEFPTPEAVALLQRWGVTYVMVWAKAYGTQWPAVEQRLRQLGALRLLGEFDEEPVYHRGWLAEALPDFGRALLTDHVYVYRVG